MKEYFVSYEDLDKLIKQYTYDVKKCKERIHNLIFETKYIRHYKYIVGQLNEYGFHVVDRIDDEYENDKSYIMVSFR